MRIQRGQPDHQNGRAEIRGIVRAAEELPALQNRAARAVGDLFRILVANSETSANIDRAKEEYTRFGQRLGELGVPLSLAEDDLENTLKAAEMESEAAAVKASESMISRIHDLVAIEIPRASKARIEAQAGLPQPPSAHQATQTRYRLALYSISTLVLMAAEYGYAGDITKMALRLTGPVWWLIPSALMFFTVVFKELYSWHSRSRAEQVYLGVLLVFLCLLTWPLAQLRTERVKDLVLGGDEAARISRPFSNNHMIKAPPDTQRRSSPEENAAGTSLFLTFLALGFLLPMLSGLCAVRAFDILLELRSIRGRREELSAAEKRVEVRALEEGRLTDELQKTRGVLLGLIRLTGKGEELLPRAWSSFISLLEHHPNAQAQKLKEEWNSIDSEIDLSGFARRWRLRVGAIPSFGDEQQDLGLLTMREVVLGVAGLGSARALDVFTSSLRHALKGGLRIGWKSGSTRVIGRLEEYSREELLSLFENQRAHRAFVIEIQRHRDESSEADRPDQVS